LAWRSFHIASRASHWFETLLAAGISLILGGQAMINLGVVTGLLPTKGIPLPFISFGGSSLVLTLFSVGLLLNVSRRMGTPVLAASPAAARRRR
jgi:cell division protein FtsW